MDKLALEFARKIASRPDRRPFSAQEFFADAPFVKAAMGVHGAMEPVNLTQGVPVTDPSLMKSDAGQSAAAQIVGNINQGQSNMSGGGGALFRQNAGVGQHGTGMSLPGGTSKK